MPLMQFMLPQLRSNDKFEAQDAAVAELRKFATEKNVRALNQRTTCVSDVVRMCVQVNVILVVGGCVCVLSAVVLLAVSCVPLTHLSTVISVLFHCGLID
jgi:hypothetical protein